jgi:hypothetical protein
VSLCGLDGMIRAGSGEMRVGGMVVVRGGVGSATRMVRTSWRVGLVHSVILRFLLALPTFIRGEGRGLGEFWPETYATNSGGIDTCGSGSYEDND